MREIAENAAEQKGEDAQNYVNEQIKKERMPQDAKIVEHGRHLTEVRSSHTRNSGKPFRPESSAFNDTSKNLPSVSLPETPSEAG